MTTKKVLAVLAVLVLALSFTACKKKEERPIVGAGAPGAGQGGSPGVMMPQAPAQVIVPDDIVGVWKAITLTVENRESQEVQDLTVNLNSEVPVPDTNLKIRAGEFMPDFRMEGSIITSASSEPNNPAAHITVYEGEEEIFAGWLFLKFPAIHPFQHDKFGITLKEGIKKG